ncbi:MAG: histidine phosphatase family protein [Cyclobacteriaceae bacterium]
MKYKRLYIVRHGETEYNRKRMVQGSGIDAPLNDTGRLQANAFYEAYKDYPFEKAFVSALIRTHQSIERFTSNGLPCQVESGLNEINWGNKEGSTFSPEAHNEYQRITNAWINGSLDEAITDGESPNQVMVRQKVAMQNILSGNERNVLICMHGRAMRILICWLLGYQLSKMDMFEHANLGLYRLTYTGSIFALDWANETAHLDGLSS